MDVLRGFVSDEPTRVASGEASPNKRWRKPVAPTIVGGSSEWKSFWQDKKGGERFFACHREEMAGVVGTGRCPNDLGGGGGGGEGSSTPRRWRVEQEETESPIPLLLRRR